MRSFRIFAFCLLSSGVSAFAQKGGDLISGIVSDSTGPMKRVVVIERDSDDCIVAHDFTNANGNSHSVSTIPKTGFSFQL